MNLETLLDIFDNNGCSRVYVKNLSPNDNSKNQVYLAGSFDILNVFPINEIIADSSGKWKKDRFKASVSFSWIQEDSSIYPAPNAQLILYPKYPEVRFSGFLARCHNPPSSLMTQRLEGRLLFLAANKLGKIFGHVSDPNCTITKEFNNLSELSQHGVFKVIDVPSSQNSKLLLLKELTRIHDLGWITSKRLSTEGLVIPCKSSNCGGYTLEAELGITPNGYSEPDYLGWELKQFGVQNFQKIYRSVITLMTPEPNGGIYKEEGVEAFIRKFGYPDLRGRKDRINFGGIHKVGIRHPRTKLRMELIGFDNSINKIKQTDGRIALIDDYGTEAASWSFTSLIKHWNRKHNQACFIPSISLTVPERKYHFGSNIILGEGTDFIFVLNELFKGNIYYDPGIKLENASTKPKSKRRSQFRTKSSSLINLYQNHELIQL
ncbi:MvaI/BcnI family restriction endonuclease [Echinicola rosea]|uniref:MvaI/BcnI restriction endonuclease domain-containing protein n=1 Tax=Echinicola rosea TaxID=1807691 RepID=A0ABQ1V2G2_9BACT|nr:MvaI/BcnI family restriction endonuclease [Echinicola rosea]GGF33412.1 hypothetical protein GCM10011339_22030 [Echinicola rosea]